MNTHEGLTTDESPHTPVILAVKILSKGDGVLDRRIDVCSGQREGACSLGIGRSRTESADPMSVAPIDCFV